MTIYRFIVEQKAATAREGRKSSAETISKKTPAKKGRYVSIFGGEKGGVEHNRKMRAINPLLNRMTGGYWEKGMRGGRAGLGLIKTNTETGALKISGTAVAILIALAITTLLKIQAKERAKANKANNQDYKMLENGFGAIHGEYEVSSNMLTGRLTYNQNK